MDLGEDLEHSPARAIDGIVDVLGLPRQMRSVSVLRLPRFAGTKIKARSLPRYFGLLADIDLAEALGVHISRRVRGGGALGDFWGALKNKRIVHSPHVAIVHSKHLPEVLTLWERCAALSALPAPPLLRVRLGHVMAVTVEELLVNDPEEDEGQEGSAFVSMLDPDIREQLHITVGTKDASVPPFEAGALVKSFKKGEKGLDSVRLGDVYVNGRIMDLFS
ncbi:hypothetical protein DFH94DRAFT_355612 [Russula ochroleuca]|jgi:tRNA ligase|uniref:Uncharacterized protein n=1 Tax=Russula ochroleuca TaxID=152965 RepID=A0A9P5JW44_9AGAM|nr:hypothetical protein DFH94DRAFT_355612 [Russula ochroleuca]